MKISVTRRKKQTNVNSQQSLTVLFRVCEATEIDGAGTGRDHQGSGSDHVHQGFDSGDVDLDQDCAAWDVVKELNTSTGGDN